MNEHRGHDTVSAAAGRTEKQKQLGPTQRKSQQRIQEREKELQDLRQAADSLTVALWGSIPLSHTVGNRLSGVPRSAQAAVEDSERIFTELIRSFEGRRSEVKELIRDQEKAAVSRAEGLIEQLEQEIAELRRRDAELEQLSQTEDHIHFLQSCQSVCAPSGLGDLPRITVNPHVSFEAVRKHVSELKERLEDICKGELVKISQTDSCQLTLDPNTAHRELRLSKGNREVTWEGEDQSYPNHPERFDSLAIVLCREGLSGHSYWEAEWRRGGIGVYLDHRAGTLSFYSISDTMTLCLAAAEPGREAIRYDRFNGAPVKGGEMGGREACLFQTPEDGAAGPAHGLKEGSLYIGSILEKAEKLFSGPFGDVPSSSPTSHAHFLFLFLFLFLSLLLAKFAAPLLYAASSYWTGSYCRNRSTRRKPTRTRGEHANSAQKGPRPGFEPETFLL
ncbi:hypothetical protein AAFF_G00441560 [Aldrovandia affinis]|uniref:SPRY-associated domain-containing protein n=1 Tax=Aldrovandia affinis TaxID=143900 RepID=A0AAD7S7B3_9TELE|nr:hypothetical protein AAFF_G00441560 [Aldrovandia affinis]